MQLEEHVSLRQVGAPVEARHVSGQGQPARRAYLVAKSCGGRASPPHHEIPDPCDRRPVDEQTRWFDEDFGPAIGLAAVVGDSARHGDGAAGERSGAQGNLWIDRGQLGSADGEQGGDQRESNQRRPDQE